MCTDQTKQRPKPFGWGGAGKTVYLHQPNHTNLHTMRTQYDETDRQCKHTHTHKPTGEREEWRQSRHACVESGRWELSRDLPPLPRGEAHIVDRLLCHVCCQLKLFVFVSGSSSFNREHGGEAQTYESAGDQVTCPIKQHHQGVSLTHTQTFWIKTCKETQSPNVLGKMFLGEVLWQT